ncbi:MAG: hypothetical protein K5663_12340 [Clostridiales bacterium]|nr:hypothetical protein [Clostridiales bacterium]
MDIKRIIKRLALICCIIICVLALSSCRTRVSSTDTGANMSDEAFQINSAHTTETVPDDATETDAAENDQGNRTRENPEASSREYDENAPVEVVPGTERELNAEGEGSGSPIDSEEASDYVSRISDLAKDTATQTVAADEAEQMGVSPDAEAADSVLTYYNVLLQSRMGSLFECKRVNVYWETPTDYQTIYKTSSEHELILNAGAYDVSSRLLSDNLRVDDGWLVRKNPGLIIKVVDGSVLGGSINSAANAKSVYKSLTARAGFSGIDAVRNRKVLLISEELFDAPYLRTYVMLLIARTAYEDVMSDTDTAEAFKRLTEEATGTIPGGIYYYSAKEE